MRQFNVYFLIAITCVLASCADPLELEVSSENDVAIQDANRRIFFPKVSDEQIESIARAKYELWFSWFILEISDSESEGILTQCSKISRRLEWIDFDGLPDLGPRKTKIDQSLTLLTLSPFDIQALVDIERETRILNHPLVPLGTSYSGLLALHQSSEAVISRLRRGFFHACAMLQVAREKGEIRVEARPPTRDEGERFGSIRPAEMFVKNETRSAIQEGWLSWQIVVLGRAAQIAQGVFEFKPVGGLEPGESVVLQFEHSHQANPNGFGSGFSDEQWTSIKEAIEIFGDGQLTMRVCFATNFWGNCRDNDGTLAAALNVITKAVKELRMIEAGLFIDVPESASEPTTKT